MRLLVIHQNFPGQFAHLVRAWAVRPGWEVRGLGRDAAPGLPGFASLDRYQLSRDARADQHPYLRSMESAVLHGQATARALQRLKSGGFTPDVVLAHPGWGETLYVKDIFPDTRLIHLCEWYYGNHGTDLDFDPEFPVTLDGFARSRTRNALHALNLVQCDAAVSPTEWQRQQHPVDLRDKIRVLHEGIAFDALQPEPTASLTMPNGTVLKAGDPVVTYVARNLEPYRGFHVFMRALEAVQKADRNVHAVIIGGDGVSYGDRPKDAANWRERMLREVKIDLTRTHFLGKVPHAKYIRALQVSAAHVYLTYPFVLSWSMLEAMACGALMIGSDTAPVREVLEHGRNGFLVPFFDVQAIAHTIGDVVSGGGVTARMRDQARKDAARFSRQNGLVGYDELLSGTVGQTAGPAHQSAT